ncbi:hypothetical protein ABBQ32_000934 [Trebouxia sp. C0010 RCD-2024]
MLSRKTTLWRSVLVSPLLLLRRPQSFSQLLGIAAVLSQAQSPPSDPQAVTYSGGACTSTADCVYYGHYCALNGTCLQINYFGFDFPTCLTAAGCYDSLNSNYSICNTVNECSYGLRQQTYGCRGNGDCYPDLVCVYEAEAFYARCVDPVDTGTVCNDYRTDCSTSADCGSGYTCNSTSSCALPVPSGGECSGSGDCAFNNVCGADNTCVLVPDFDYGNSLILCNSTADCLAPSFCNSDYECLFTFSYMEVGCRSDRDCGDMVCVGSDPTTAYCKPGTLVGSACSATDTCDRGLVCSNGSCATLEAGTSCSQTSDCGHGQLCISNNTCQIPGHPGSSCLVPSDLARIFVSKVSARRHNLKGQTVLQHTHASLPWSVARPQPVNMVVSSTITARLQLIVAMASVAIPPASANCQLDYQATAAQQLTVLLSSHVPAMENVVIRALIRKAAVHQVTVGGPQSAIPCTLVLLLCLMVAHAKAWASVGTDSYAALLAHVRYPHRPTNIVTQQLTAQSLLSHTPAPSHTAVCCLWMMALFALSQETAAGPLSATPHTRVLHPWHREDNVKAQLTAAAVWFAIILACALLAKQLVQDAQAQLTVCSRIDACKGRALWWRKMQDAWTHVGSFYEVPVGWGNNCNGTEDCLNNAPCTDYVCEAVDSDSNAQAGDGGMYSLPAPMLPLAMSPQGLVYVVQATVTRSAYNVRTFNNVVQQQLTATLANSIQALTRSSVDVRVTAVVAANGAAVNATTLASFPSDKSSNAQLYVAALLGSGSSSIFTSTLGTVTVDPSSVQISLAVPQAGQDFMGSAAEPAETFPAAASPPPTTVAVPPPPPPPPAVVTRAPLAAPTVPAVSASQTLSAYTVDTFTQDVQKQFIATVVKNVEALSGSAVQVTIDSVTAGSVKVASTVVFLSGDSASASSYQAAITSGIATRVFGTSFGAVAVDQSSIKASTVSNPGSGGIRSKINWVVVGAAAMLGMVLLS